MKRNLIFIIIADFVLIIALLLCLCAPIYAAEETDMDMGYDGYLISLPLGLPLRSSGIGSGSLSYVAKNLYLTEDYALAQRLLSIGAAEYIEPNYQLTLFSDENYDWSYEAVSGDSAYKVGLDGSGVKIAVIDSGLNADNANLAGAMIADGYDYLNNTTNMTDDVGHGTYVSQVIVGVGNGGVTGVARGAEIVPLRCFSSNTGDVASAVRAIYDAVDLYNCSVINMSWGMKPDSNALHAAIQYAYDADVALVASAGNVSSEYPQGTALYPAAYVEVVGVGAVDSSYAVANYSMQTGAVSVCAPGSGIYFKHYSSDLSVINDGTSFAAPYVTAETALLRQLSPSMSNVEIADLMKDRAEDLGDEGYDYAYGYGFVSMKVLLEKPWYRLDVKDDVATIDGWYCGNGGGYIIVAAYDKGGMMCNCSVLSNQTGAASFHFNFVSNNVNKLKLFAADFSFMPAMAVITMEL